MLKVAIFLAIFATYSTDHSGITPQKLRCVWNYQYLPRSENQSCLINKEQDIPTVNLKMTFGKELKSLWIQAQLYFKHTSYDPFFIRLLFDYCLYMKGSNRNRMSELIMNLINPYAFVFHACPYKPLEHFMIKDLIVTPKSLPVIIPFGEYRLDLEFLEDENGKTRYLLVQAFFIVKNVKK